MNITLNSFLSLLLNTIYDELCDNFSCISVGKNEFCWTFLQKNNNNYDKTCFFFFLCTKILKHLPPSGLKRNNNLKQIGIGFRRSWFLGQVRLGQVTKKIWAQVGYSQLLEHRNHVVFYSVRVLTIRKLQFRNTSTTERLTIIAILIYQKIQ